MLPLQNLNPSTILSKTHLLDDSESFLEKGLEFEPFSERKNL